MKYEVWNIAHRTSMYVWVCACTVCTVMPLNLIFVHFFLFTRQKAIANTQTLLYMTFPLEVFMRASIHVIKELEIRVHSPILMNKFSNNRSA